MGEVGLFAILIGMLYVLYKQSQEEKERKRQLLIEIEENKRRKKEEKEQELQELKLLSEMRSSGQGSKRIISKTKFVGKCPSCGAAIKDASAFCMYCGTDLRNNVQEHTEYIDTRTPIEKKIDVEYVERMEKVKNAKQERWITVLLVIVFLVIAYTVLRPFFVLLK